MIGNTDIRKITNPEKLCHKQCLKWKVLIYWTCRMLQSWRSFRFPKFHTNKKLWEFKVTNTQLQIIQLARYRFTRLIYFCCGNLRPLQGILHCLFLFNREFVRISVLSPPSSPWKTWMASRSTKEKTTKKNKTKKINIRPISEFPFNSSLPFAEINDIFGRSKSREKKLYVTPLQR